MKGRHEFKYIINEELASMIIKEAGDRLTPDEYGEEGGEYIISSLYYDNDRLEFYHQTYDRAPYRTKLRLRVYSETNTPASISFFETKSKLCGESIKTRHMGKLEENLALFDGKIKPETSHEKDIVNLVNRYKLKPTAVVSYKRNAYLDPEKPRMRVTFDSELRIRMDDLDLTHGTYGTSVMEKGMVVLEVKNDENMPKWLCGILTKYRLMNQCYSKYGQIGQLIQKSTHPAAGIYVIPRPIMTIAASSGELASVQLR